MSAIDAGFRYPDIVRAGIHYVLDTLAGAALAIAVDVAYRYLSRVRLVGRNSSSTKTLLHVL